MVVICEATGMAITYFTQSAKEDESLLLSQDFVTRLALQYNLKVKVIQLNSKKNHIKTKKWCNNMGISLEPSTQDTHVQNERAKKFRQLIMEKLAQ